MKKSIIILILITFCTCFVIPQKAAIADSSNTLAISLGGITLAFLIIVTVKLIASKAFDERRTLDEKTINNDKLAKESDFNHDQQSERFISIKTKSGKEELTLGFFQVKF